MTLKPDVSSRADIELLVERFYNKAIPDEVIGHFFTTVRPLDLAEHIPTISNFWENLLLGNQVYQGNPMRAHLLLDKLSSMKPEHFARWLFLWQETVDSLFHGPTADLAKEKAQMVARSMRMRVEDLRHFPQQ